MTLQTHRHGETRVRIAWWILLVVAVGVSLFIRGRLLAIPLERDEGEFGYAGQLLLQGIPPYRLAYNMKFPGTYAAYALVMALFGQTPTGIHLGLLVVNLATITLIFALARRILNTIGAIVAAASYAILTINPAFLGLAGHAVNYVLLPALAGILLLLRPRPSRPWWNLPASGMLFGFAILMKQPGVFFLVGGGLCLLWLAIHDRSGWRLFFIDGCLLTFGALFPIALTFIALWMAGVFPRFWFWCIDYARAYGTIVPLREGVLIAAMTARKSLGAIWPSCALACVGLLGLSVSARFRQQAVLIVLFLAASVAALSSGFYFREHYYIFLLPVLSLLMGAGIFALLNRPMIGRRWVEPFCFLLVTASLLHPLWRGRHLFFAAAPTEACSQIYRGNIFGEAPRLGAYLREHTVPTDTIGVIGSEPEIYFYAQRHSATGYIYTYALMEEHPYVRRMQEEMRAEIERSQPSYLVFVSLPNSWFVASWSDENIIHWAVDYAAANYHMVGFINLSAEGTDYCLPCARKPDGQPSALILRRNL